MRCIKKLKDTYYVYFNSHFFQMNLDWAVLPQVFFPQKKTLGKCPCHPTSSGTNGNKLAPYGNGGRLFATDVSATFKVT